MARTPRKVVEEPAPTPRRSLFFCCCGSAVDDLAQEVQLQVKVAGACTTSSGAAHGPCAPMTTQVKAARAPPPLELQHGYANEENEKRGMAAPKYGAFEVVNKNRQGEIIGVRPTTKPERISCTCIDAEKGTKPSAGTRCCQRRGTSREAA